MRTFFRTCSLLLPALLTAQAPQTAEVTMKDMPATFRAKVNLVLVPVVVRDKQGRAVGTLKKEDFVLYDKGKVQFIARFSVEKAGTSHVEFEPDPMADPNEPKKPPPADLAEHYTIYLFDDMHVATGDLMQVRKAADEHLATTMRPTDRAAIYTTSGQTMVDFTDDRAKLHDALLRIQPRSRLNTMECPPMTYYMADLIQNKNDQQALGVATTEALICGHLDPTMMSAAQSMAQSAASRALSTGDADSRMALNVLKSSVRRLAAMPGQRGLVLISPGFLTPYLHTEVTESIDAAIRARVTVNSLDARGLYGLGGFTDASQQTLSASTVAQKSMYERMEASANEDILGELADGTGGIFYHNSNDLVGGLQRVASVPEYSYIIGFSPENLKLDGSYHTLKVKIKEPNGLTLQARRGYFAPKHLTDPAEEAKREIEEALFSREVVRDIPVEMHTQFFKSTEIDAKLAVLARIDLAQLHFRKADGRNLNNLTVVSGLFDRNGNFLQALTKTVEMKLKDETLTSKARSVITVKSGFDVKSGSYVIRVVVRDAEGQQMAAQNGAVEIP
jgi:VWFA-related protein